MNSLRILYIVDEIRDVNAGGTERQVAQLVQMAMVSGHHAEVAVLRHASPFLKRQLRCEVTDCGIIKLWSGNGVRGMYRLSQLIRDGEFNIVQTFFVDANLIGPLVSRLAGAKVVIGSRRNTNTWMSARVARLQRISNLFSHRLLGNSQKVREAVINTEKVHPSKVDVIHNGIDLSCFVFNPVRRRKIRAHLGIGADDFLIGNISRLEPVKGVDTFIRAMSRVREAVPNAHFVSIGEGTQRRQLEDLRQSLNLTRHLRFLGNRSDITPYLMAMDMAVLSSRAEGLSNSLLEYMAAGLPVVASDLDANREALGDCAVFAPVEDVDAYALRIQELYRDRRLRERLAFEGRRRVSERFSMPAIQRDLFDYYHKLCDKPEVIPTTE